MTYHLTPKQFAAQTGRNIDSVVKAAHASSQAIAQRFDGVDGYMERIAQELAEMVDEWAKNARATIDEAMRDGTWDARRFEGLGV